VVRFSGSACLLLLMIVRYVLVPTSTSHGKLCTNMYVRMIYGWSELGGINTSAIRVDELEKIIVGGTVLR
jgi:hypothetical protein